MIARQGSKVSQQVVRGVIVCGMLLFAGFLAVTIFGHIRGEEFAPHDFQRRQFTYFEVPLVHIQVTPIWRDNTTGATETFLFNEKLLAPVGKTEWHLVYAQQGGQPPLRGDASILCEYLDAESSANQHVWQIWTKDHPRLAKVLWPAVANLARKNRYLFIPDLMDLAGRAEQQSPAWLQAQIDATLASRYRELAKSQRELGNTAAADEMDEDAERLESQSESVSTMLERPDDAAPAADP